MRRCRYTATISHRESDAVLRRVILAYDAGSVQRHFERCGYTVLDVHRGDYRVEARMANAKSGGGFTVDQAALNRAIQTLGLRLPVRIRFNSRVGSTNGNYRFMGGYHNIMLKSYRTAEQASETLWHELTHAMQAERAGGTLEAWAKEQRKSRGKYQACPREIEARQMSRQMSDVRLCK